MKKLLRKLYLVVLLMSVACSKKILPELDNRYTYHYGGYEYQFMKEAKWEYTTTKFGYWLPTIIGTSVGFGTVAVTEKPITLLGSIVASNIIAAATNKTGSSTFVKDRELSRYMSLYNKRETEQVERTKVNIHGIVLHRQKNGATDTGDFSELPNVEITTSNVEVFFYPFKEFKYPLTMELLIEDQMTTLSGYSFHPLINGQLADGFNTVQLYAKGDTIPLCFLQGETSMGKFNGIGLKIHRCEGRPWFKSYRGLFSNNEILNPAKIDEVVDNFLKSSHFERMSRYKKGDKQIQLAKKLKGYSIYQSTYVPNPFNDKVTDGHSISLICYYDNDDSNWISFKIFKASAAAGENYTLLNSDIPEVFSRSLMAVSAKKVNSRYGFMNKVADQTTSDEVGGTLLYRPAMTTSHAADEEVAESNQREHADKYFNYDSELLSFPCVGRFESRISCGMSTTSELEYNQYSGAYETVTNQHETFAYNLCSDVTFFARSQRNQKPVEIGSLTLVQKASCFDFSAPKLNDENYIVYGNINNKDYWYSTDFTWDKILNEVHTDFRKDNALVPFDTTMDVYAQQCLNNVRCFDIMTEVSKSSLASKSGEGFIGCWMDINHLRLYLVDEKIGSDTYKVRYLQFTDNLLSEAAPEMYLKNGIYKLSNSRFENVNLIGDIRIHGDPESEYSNQEVIKQNSDVILLANGVALRRISPNFQFDAKNFFNYKSAMDLLSK